MLINLTTKNLSGLGKVISGGMNDATSRLGISLVKNRITDRTSFRTLYIHDTKGTALDKISGTAVLFCGKSPNRLQAFLLDKTVLLEPGVYYYVLPLIGQAQISVCAPPGTRTESIGVHTRAVSMLPLIEPTEIFTLFHHEKERGFHFPGEKHNFWELTYVERGILHNVIDGKDTVQNEGEITLFLPNQFHSQYAEPNQRVFYVTIGFDMQIKEAEVFKNSVFKADHESCVLFRKMFEERDFGTAYRDDLILCYLKELLIRLLRSRQVEQVVKHIPIESRPTLENTIVLAAEDYVHRNLNRRLTVSEIADSIPVSETYLSSLFKKSTGESLNRYINTQKIQLACDYIRSGLYTFTEIAEILGYSTVHYFSQSFKRYVGMSPTEYANSLT